MTEAEARALLQRQPGGFNEVEGWLAEQPWEATPNGWTVASELEGWHLRIEVIFQGLRIHAGQPDATPGRWIITG